MKEISFKVNKDKTLETIVYIANKMPGIDHYHVVKTIFYADKKHLNKYGRPITGDIYIKMWAGPAPSTALDIINFNSLKFDCAPNFFEKILNSFAITQNKRKKLIVPLRETNLDELSESDIECLNESFEFCGNKTFDEIFNMSHQEKAWREAIENKQMSFLLMIDDDNPMKHDIIEDLKENSMSLVF